MIVMGSMIGSGIFITSAESSQLVGSPGWLLAAWGIAGLLTVTGAICAAEVAAMMPRAGGQYVFLREAYGPSIGFLFGWSMFLVVQTGTIAAVAVAFSKYLGVLMAGDLRHYPFWSRRSHLGRPGYAIGLSTQQAVAISVIALLTAVNTRGLKTGKSIQNTFTIHQDGRADRLDRGGDLFRLESGLGGLDLVVVERRRPTAGRSKGPRRICRVVGKLAFVLLLGKAMIGPCFRNPRGTA